MISKIFEEVKSPFTDELIEDLIKKYVNCGCDDNLFYDEVNQINSSYEGISTNVNKLIAQICSQGIDIGELWNYSDEENIPLIYDINSSWVVLSSEKDPMKDSKIALDKKRPLLYRIYLNLKD